MASIPPTSLCLNCHSQIWRDSPVLEPVRSSWRTGESLEWIKVYDLPGYVYFNHSIHVAKGVGCATCHGDVTKMNVLWQAPSLQMEWCIDCHRGNTPLSAAEEASVQQRSSFVRRVRDLRVAGSDTRGVPATRPRQRASTDCVACHY